jgi:hypothetical protein
LTFRRGFRSLCSRNGARLRTRGGGNKGGGQHSAVARHRSSPPLFPLLPPRCTAPFRRHQEAEPPPNRHDIANNGTSFSQGHPTTLLHLSKSPTTTPTHTAPTIPPTSGGGTSTEPHGIAKNGTSTPPTALRITEPPPNPTALRTTEPPFLAKSRFEN